MASDVISSINKIINQTTTEIIDSELPKKVATILNTLVNSSFDAMDDLLKKVQDITKETP